MLESAKCVGVMGCCLWSGTKTRVEEAEVEMRRGEEKDGHFFLGVGNTREGDGPTQMRMMQDLMRVIQGL